MTTPVPPQALVTKLTDQTPRVRVRQEEAKVAVYRILLAYGMEDEAAAIIAAHLVDANLCGVESHGVMRILQYADQFDRGYMKPTGRAERCHQDGFFQTINGLKGHGIPVMKQAFDWSMEVACAHGITVTSVVNLGHTGRHGAFADAAAKQGFMTILIGGGNRNLWRQVAPYGGIEPKLPTNPYCIGIPGDEHGPFVLDFATAMIAGGWIYAAENAGATLPEGVMIDKHGAPSVNPQDYFDGGAILPAAGQKGYALALAAELIAEALIGPVETEANWLLLMIDTTRMTSADHLKARAEVIFADMKNTRPAPNVKAVEIPGQRERALREAADGQINLPEKTWQDIRVLDRKMASHPWGSGGHG